MKARYRLLYPLPTLALLAWVAFPLARGSDTFYLRDVLNTHLPLKHAQAEAMRSGTLPLLDPYRAAGQPLLGNPNAVPLYPDNLLYLAGSTLWALNAHFWLHLLLAAPAMAWLGHAWGLSRRAAWAAGVAYALSGYYLSHMSFYNLVAAATLAPAFAAACLRLAEGRRSGRWAAAAGGLWALLLLGGDPLLALLALALGVSAAVARGTGQAAAALADPGDSSAGVAPRAAPGHSAGATAPADPADSTGVRSPTAPGDPAAAASPAERGDSHPPAVAAPRKAGRLAFWGWLAPAGLALGCGLLVAAPQIVEFLRILPASFRGSFGFSSLAATVASWDPRQALDWLLPFPFGRPDLLGPGSFWGHRFYTDTPPYYYALYPGLATLALVAASGRPRGRAAWWAWGAAAAGLFLSLGRFNPLASWVFSLPGLRYPVKLWLPVAVGGALLAGIGFERLFVAGEAPARRRWLLALGALALALGTLWGLLTFAPGWAEGVLRSLVPADRPWAFVTGERLRWAALCLASLAVVAGLAMAGHLARRRPWGGGAAVLLLHAAAQLFFLAPLVSTDAALPYQTPSPVLEEVPPEAVTAHGAFAKLFGPSTLYAGRFPEPRTRWLYRRAFFELYPPAGTLWGRRYALNVSPEGLDSFHTRLAKAAVQESTDLERVRLLAAFGADRLLLDRRLSRAAAAEVDLLAEIPSSGQQLLVYGVPGALGEAQLLGRVVRSPDPGDTFDRLTAPGFEPRTTAVVAGPGPELDEPPGTVEVLATGAESFEARVRSPEGGVLVLRRARLPLWRASLDGRPARTALVNLHLLGLEVPAGEHRVRLWVDRRPLVVSALASLVGLTGLLGLAFVWWRPARAEVEPAGDAAADGTPAGAKEPGELGDEEDRLESRT